MLLPLMCNDFNRISVPFAPTSDEPTPPIPRSDTASVISPDVTLRPSVEPVSASPACTTAAVPARRFANYIA